MSLIDVPELAVKEIRVLKQSITETITSGSVKDWDAYKMLVGQLQGLSHMENFILTKLKNDE